ncbi:MAG TPA: ATP-binding protein [Thermodesulfobacteriota bacterium]|nr:ATP-binding protein [Thermodesulfobacteriota bacterium]
MNQAAPPRSLRSRLLAMMVLRVVLALAFLGITAWFQTREHSFTALNLLPLYAVVITIGLLTIIYALLLNRINNLRLFTYVQITVDIAVITAIVFVTGGIESYLNTLYSLAVIGASIFLGKRGGYYTASLSSIAYGVLIDLDFYGVLPAKYEVYASVTNPSWEDALRTSATNILAFFTVAYLTGHLAERTAAVEKELEEREVDYEKLEVLTRHIFENITSGIMTLDELARITSFNREAELVTGYSLREVYYRDVNEIFPGMINVRASRDMRVERKFRKKSGEEIFLGFSISAGQGGNVDNIVIFQDLTKLKEMEEQLRRDEKLKALGELSVGIAHEIRNPLASISGSIQVLEGELEMSGENRRLMDIVLRETERLNLLITDFLLFAKPAKENRFRVELDKIIADTIEVFSNSPEAASIKIESRVDPGAAVEADARQLGQVFWNLFVNAAHAMPSGGTLTVSSAVDPLGGIPGKNGVTGPGSGVVSISVEDTGMGIRPEHIHSIFDPFFSTKERGTGLGLAIVHRIIESHGGIIDVKSFTDGGTVFRITLPLAGEKALI